MEENYWLPYKTYLMMKRYIMQHNMDMASYTLCLVW